MGRFRARRTKSRKEADTAPSGPEPGPVEAGRRILPINSSWLVEAGPRSNLFLTLGRRLYAARCPIHPPAGDQSPDIRNSGIFHHPVGFDNDLRNRPGRHIGLRGQVSVGQHRSALLYSDRTARRAHGSSRLRPRRPWADRGERHGRHPEQLSDTCLPSRHCSDKLHGVRGDTWGWVGNYTVAVTYGGRLHSFPAWTGASVNVDTLSVPSGSTKIETIECLGPLGAC